MARQNQKRKAIKWRIKYSDCDGKVEHYRNMVKVWSCNGELLFKGNLLQFIEDFKGKMAFQISDENCLGYYEPIPIEEMIKTWDYSYCGPGFYAYSSTQNPDYYQVDFWDENDVIEGVRFRSGPFEKEEDACRFVELVWL